MHIVANPFTNLRLERPKGRKDLDALTEPEIRELADAVVPALGMYGAEFRAILIFLAYVGCRPGELCCIRRADLDRESAEVTIRFALDGQGGERSPKNGRPRVVTVPPLALAALADVPTWLTGPYLFHATTGRRLSKGSTPHGGPGLRAPPDRGPASALRTGGVARPSSGSYSCSARRARRSPQRRSRRAVFARASRSTGWFVPPWALAPIAKAYSQECRCALSAAVASSSSILSRSVIDVLGLRLDRASSC
jgi:hypothetical protein